MYEISAHNLSHFAWLWDLGRIPQVPHAGFTSGYSVRSIISQPYLSLAKFLVVKEDDMADALENTLLERLLEQYLETHGSSQPRYTKFDRAHSIWSDWDVGWAVAHNAPNIGGGGGGIRILMRAVTSKVAAANMSDKKAAQMMMAAADNAIAEYLDSDDICPPWPYPGPPPWLVDLASMLTYAANTVQPGALQTEMLRVAGLVLDRAQSLSQGVSAEPAKKSVAAA